MEKGTPRLISDKYINTVVDASLLLKELVDKYANEEIDTETLKYNINYYFHKYTELMANGSNEEGYSWLKTIRNVIGKRRIRMLSKVLEDYEVNIQ